MHCKSLWIKASAKCIKCKCITCAARKQIYSASHTPSSSSSSFTAAAGALAAGAAFFKAFAGVAFLGGGGGSSTSVKTGNGAVRNVQVTYE